MLSKLGRFKMIFADPPDNIGLGYNDYTDKVSQKQYTRLLQDILNLGMARCDILWLSFNARHLPIMGTLVDDVLYFTDEWEFKAGVQIFTFGQHNKHDLGNNHRPLWRLMKKDAVIYPDAIRVPSWRQLNGDKRANPKGRVPGDVFDFPRVVGNSKQRRKWHPTQLHEGLYERCVKLSCCADDKACDIFAGTGTLARVCEPLGISSTLVEMDLDYCKEIVKEHDLQVYTDEWFNVSWRSK
ncbi:MAG: DNA methyltransferase [Planctomycetota bacterium]